jgi:hypothetical protein
MSSVGPKKYISIDPSGRRPRSMPDRCRRWRAPRLAAMSKHARNPFFTLLSLIDRWLCIVPKVNRPVVDFSGSAATFLYLSWRPLVSAPCHRSSCTARDRFCNRAAQAALPGEIQCHCTLDICPRLDSRLAVSFESLRARSAGSWTFEVWQAYCPPSSTPTRRRRRRRGTGARRTNHKLNFSRPAVRFNLFRSRCLPLGGFRSARVSGFHRRARRTFHRA